MSYSNGLLNFKNENKQVILKGAPDVHPKRICTDTLPFIVQGSG